LKLVPHIVIPLFLLCVFSFAFVLSTAVLSCLRKTFVRKTLVLFLIDCPLEVLVLAVFSEFRNITILIQAPEFGRGRFKIFAFAINTIFCEIGKPNSWEALVFVVDILVVFFTKLDIQSKIEIPIALLYIRLGHIRSKSLIQIFQVKSIFQVASSDDLYVGFLVAHDEALQITFIDDFTILGILRYVFRLIAFDQLVIIAAIFVITVLFAIFNTILSIAIEKVLRG